MQLQMPQEIEVWYVLPAIRRKIAKQMLSAGLKQKEIAKSLKVTEPAVSQYLKSKRAKKVNFNKKINKSIKKSAELLMKNKSCVIREIQKCCKLVREEGILCKIHVRESNVAGKCKGCLCLK